VVCVCAQLNSTTQRQGGYASQLTPDIVHLKMLLTPRAHLTDDRVYARVCDCVRVCVYVVCACACVRNFTAKATTPSQLTLDIVQLTQKPERLITHSICALHW